ncbi:16672_t:CDS:2, partial [Entrophospora sp. SA101]
MLSTNSSNSNSANEDLRLQECFSDDNGKTSSRYRDNCLKLNKLSHLEELEEEGRGVGAGGSIEETGKVKFYVKYFTFIKMQTKLHWLFLLLYHSIAVTTGVKREVFPKHQRNANIQCHRPPDLDYIGQPVVLYREVFSQFLRDCSTIE